MYYHFFFKKNLRSILLGWSLRRIGTVNGFGDVLISSFMLRENRTLLIHEDNGSWHSNSKRNLRFVDGSNYIEEFLDYIGVEYRYVSDVRKERCFVFFWPLVKFYGGYRWQDWRFKEYFYRETLKDLDYIYVSDSTLANEVNECIGGSLKIIQNNSHDSFVEKLCYLANANLVVGSRGGFAMFSRIFDVDALILWDEQGNEEFLDGVWCQSMWRNNIIPGPVGTVTQLRHILHEIGDSYTYKA